MTRVTTSLDPHMFVSLYLYVKLCCRLLGSSDSFPVVLVTELGSEAFQPSRLASQCDISCSVS